MQEQTIITIQPLHPSMRLPGESSTPTEEAHDGRLDEDEVFAKVYSRAAELGHDHTWKNGWNSYSFRYV